jgi:hypothetical protein
VQQVKLGIDVIKTLEIVSEIKQQGWVLGIDFDFSYHKAMYDNFSGSNWEPEIESHCVFTFYNDSNASYFMLRWG